MTVFFEMIGNTITYIDQVSLSHQRVLLRVDFNVSLTEQFTISDDTRIRQSLPTIEYLLKSRNRLIIISHLGQPKERNGRYSLGSVVEYLKKVLPIYSVELVPDFLSPGGYESLKNQTEKQVLVLENIRFYPEEKSNDPVFAQKLSQLGDVYVNDSFGVDHREDASVVGVPKILPHYGGLLLKKEIQAMVRIVDEPKKPFVAIMGGAKLETKLPLLSKLLDISDTLLVGGGIANTLLAAKGYVLGQSFVDEKELGHAKDLLQLAIEKKTELVLPRDGVVENNEVRGVGAIQQTEKMVDIGPETQALFATRIISANTIVWNGPMGLIEKKEYQKGTDFIFYAISQNRRAYSVVGGGDTLVALSNKEHLNYISHISTGGGAMLEFIEKGTLPGIEALK
ncbi:MAG: phosphoglycerate kinase [Patescibacteria group bacterium]